MDSLYLMPQAQEAREANVYANSIEIHSVLSRVSQDLVIITRPLALACRVVITCCAAPYVIRVSHSQLETRLSRIVD